MKYLLSAVVSERLERVSELLKQKTIQINDKVHELSPLLIRYLSAPSECSQWLSKPLRIAHLTDQHVGKVTPLWVQLDAVEQTNSLNPDLIILTGDFVCHSELYLADLSYIISQFKAPVFAVLGNHNHWTNAELVTRALKAGGAEVLHNANTVVEINGERIQLVGLDDAYTGHADVQKAINGMKSEIATLGLSHIAEEAPKLWEAHIPLVLSGHTHGGQITVAGINEILMKRMSKRNYIQGLYGSMVGEAAAGSVYVSAGIGSAVVPLRLGDAGRREIAIFDFFPTKS